MTRAVHALLLALRDLPQPRVLRILALSLALTLLIFVAAGAAIFFATRWGLARTTTVIEDPGGMRAWLLSAALDRRRWAAR